MDKKEQDTLSKRALNNFIEMESLKDTSRGFKDIDQIVSSQGLNGDFGKLVRDKDKKNQMQIQAMVDEFKI